MSAAPAGIHDLRATVNDIGSTQLFEAHRLLVLFLREEIKLTGTHSSG